MSSLRNIFARTAVAAWFVVLTTLCAGLLARHAIALPSPEPTAALGKRLSGFVSGDRTFLAVHVLSSDCKCSLRIARHLTESQRPSGWREVVLWVGDEAPATELVARFETRRIRASELAELGIEAVPMLIAVDPNGDVRYVGGYTDRKQGPVFRDLDVLTMARVIALSPMPVYGCATSERLQRQLARLPVP